MFTDPFDVTDEHPDVIFVVISPYLPVTVMEFWCGVRPVSVWSFVAVSCQGVFIIDSIYHC